MNISDKLMKIKKSIYDKAADVDIYYEEVRELAFNAIIKASRAELDDESRSNFILDFIDIVTLKKKESDLLYGKERMEQFAETRAIVWNIPKEETINAFTKLYNERANDYRSFLVEIDQLNVPEQVKAYISDLLKKI